MFKIRKKWLTGAKYTVFQPKILTGRDIMVKRVKEVDFWTQSVPLSSTSPAN